MLIGALTKENTKMIPENIPSKDLSNYSQTKYKFFLEAPFDISSECCKVMKKKPVHEYARKSGRHPITAQMASESRLRTQKWLQSGCNAFEGKNPISNPMSFWTEQDVLLYIRLNNLKIASVYGDIITEDERSGQITIADLVGAEQKGIFELDRPTLCTTGCSRTGCVFCMYGAHLEKRPNRLETMLQVTNPNLYDYMMRGGTFVDGKWQPTNNGLGFWFPIAWINSHSTIRYYAPNLEKYMKEYGTEKTEKYLKEM